MKLAMVFYTSGYLSGGAAKHLRKVVPLVLEDTRVGELLVMVPDGAIDGLPADWPVEHWQSGGRAGSAELRRRLSSFAPDVVFIPSARWFDAGVGRTLVMVRNMEPLETPFAGNRITDKIRNIGRRFGALHACRKADRIIAVSEHVRSYLTNEWSVADEKIAVVYHGVEDPPEPVRPRTLADTPAGSFLFTAGSIRPARGLPDLIRALADPHVPGDTRLVVAGASDPGVDVYRAELDALSGALGVGDRILWAGQLGPAEMSWCFANCDLFVTTSRAEACPNTVLEAMRHGRMSVSGNNAPMPEFFGDSAIYYRIGDPSSLAQAIGKALALPPAERASREACAFERSRHYTWKRTAYDTVTQALATVADHKPEGLHGE